MKSQISRNSHRRRKRYSGVYQQQGRMVLDADGNEQVDISKERLNSALGDVVGSGIPRDSGLAIVSDGNGGFLIVPGRIYVDGIPGEVRATDTYANVPYEHQEDFPSAPEVVVDVTSPPSSPPTEEPYRVYADLWERTVLPLEDPALLDRGLHGADTCTRTQTMVQVKWCPGDVDPEDRNRNPQCGSARLSLDLRVASSATDQCDPCAEELALGTEGGNYLFRVEVHDVGVDTAGRPILVLKWSSENGAEQFRVDEIPSDFASGSWVYEFYNERTEKHLGHHLVGAPSFPERGILTTTWSNAVDPLAYPYVRRWDGYCQLVYTGGAWALAADGGAALGCDRGVPLTPTNDEVKALGEVNLGNDLVINLSAIQLRLALWEDGADSVFVAGDYWLAPVRAEDGADSPPSSLLDAESPQGIIHHYMLLAEISGNVVTRPPGLLCKRYAFPPLTDLRATDICIDNVCPEILGEGATNVQDVLTNLCGGISADAVAYDDPNCTSPAGGTSIRALLAEKFGADWLDADGNGDISVKDALDTLFCRLGAAGVPLDKTDPRLCAELAAAGVRTVQDAVVTLCNVGGAGGGCAVSVGTGGVYATLDEAIAALDGREAVSFCLQPGEYSLLRSFSRPPRSLRIVGSGRTASIIKVADDYELAAGDILLRDLAFELASQKGLVLNASRVDVRTCDMRRSTGRRTLQPVVTVTSANGGYLNWVDNGVSATWRETDVSALDSVYLPEVSFIESDPSVGKTLKSLLRVDPALDRPEYERLLDAAAEKIAGLPAARRREWRDKAVRTAIPNLSEEKFTHLELDPLGPVDLTALFSRPEMLRSTQAEVDGRTAATEFFKTIGAANASQAKIREALDRGLLSQAITGFDIGLGFETALVGGSVRGSLFMSYVAVNVGAADAREVSDKQVVGNDSVRIDAEASLTVSGNYLQRFVVLIPSASVDATGRLTGAVPGFASLILTDNVVYGEPSILISVVTTMTGNLFPRVADKTNVAEVLTDSLVVGGNVAPAGEATIVTSAAAAARAVSGNLRVTVP